MRKRGRPPGRGLGRKRGNPAYQRVTPYLARKSIAGMRRWLVDHELERLDFSDAIQRAVDEFLDREGLA